MFKVVREINTSKSSGLTNVSSCIVKEAFGILLPEVTFMFNLSLNCKSSVWKKTLIIPVPKTGDLTQVENYRPISLLPLSEKVLEKLIDVQLSDYLEGGGLYF